MKRINYGEPQKLPGQMDEHFVLVDNESEAKFVNGRLNDREAAARKKRRMDHLRQRGEVNEVLMPDTYSGLMWQAHRLMEQMAVEAMELNRQLEAAKASAFWFWPPAPIKKD